ncbi:MAG: fatty acid cis/trans isomerase [Pseudomonadota bacterium]|nr:fatty acid cis/trans isomerase [Pseudomonadota bacterium]
MRRLLFVSFALVISGCATVAFNVWDDLYGISDPDRLDHPVPSTLISYQNDVQPILNQRCVVCHACYDAPCQLKLTAYEGITRGANKEYIYESSRLLATEPTRLFHDALSTSDWRTKGFYPVLNERRNDAEANINASVLAQLLLQKQAHPLPDVAVLPDSFDFNLHRDQQCSNLDNYQDYQESYPLWGMPYGLPGLEQQEHDTLMRWLEVGSPYEPPTPLSASLQQQVQQWEAFFNQDSLQARLMSRYMFEHLYMAQLYFDDSSEPVFFDLVRSRTPPSQPLDLISTRRPYDDPKVERVYYRLRRHQETPVVKTHMPYRLDEERMANWREWFLNDHYQVSKLPTYDIKAASNPFVTFQEIPSYARYRFMLEEAQYTIMGFIKSPVCRGQVALNVINDHFWVTFLHPKFRSSELAEQALQESIHLLKLPAKDSSSAGLLNWMSYANNEQKYIAEKTRFLNAYVDKQFKVSLDLLWDGDGDNDNAALTIYRHFDSASVIKGLHGGKPQTAWVITYPLLERIHYLLVAGFDVFGNVGHQLNTRIYMDFLRMEGEFNFLTLLPKADRQTVHNQWYRGSVNPVKEYIYQYAQAYEGSTSVEYQSQDHLQELYLKLQDKLKPVLNQQFALTQGFQEGTVLAALSDLDNITGQAAANMPQMSVIRLKDDNSDRVEYYSVLSNSAFTNISHLFGDEDRRLPQEDDLTVSHGLLGSYPNVFFEMTTTQIPEFVAQVQQIKNRKDYIKLLDRYAVRRTNPAFWQYSDDMHQAFKQAKPIEFGYLDYNRLANQ